MKTLIKDLQHGSISLHALFRLRYVLCFNFNRYVFTICYSSEDASRRLYENLQELIENYLDDFLRKVGLDLFLILVKICTDNHCKLFRYLSFFFVLGLEWRRQSRRRIPRVLLEELE